MEALEFPDWDKFYCGSSNNLGSVFSYSENIAQSFFEGLVGRQGDLQSALHGYRFNLEDVLDDLIVSYRFPVLSPPISLLSGAISPT